MCKKGYFSLLILVIILAGCKPSGLDDPSIPSKPPSEPPGTGSNGSYEISLISDLRTFLPGVADTLEFSVIGNDNSEQFVTAEGYDTEFKDMNSNVVPARFESNMPRARLDGGRYKLVVSPMSVGNKTLNITFRDGRKAGAREVTLKLQVDVNTKVYRVRLERAFADKPCIAGMKAVYNLYVVDQADTTAVRAQEFKVRARRTQSLNADGTNNAPGCNISVGDKLVWCDSIVGHGSQQAIIPNMKWDMTMDAYLTGSYKIAFEVTDQHGQVSTDFAEIEAIRPTTTITLNKEMPATIAGESSFNVLWGYDMHNHINNVIEMKYSITHTSAPNNTTATFGKTWCSGHTSIQPGMWYQVGESLVSNPKIEFNFKPATTGGSYTVEFVFRDKYTAEVLRTAKHTFTSTDTGFTITNKRGTEDQTRGIAAFCDNSIVLELGNFTRQDEFTWFVRRANQSNDIHLLESLTWNKSTSTGLCLQKTREITIPFYAAYQNADPAGYGLGDFDVVITDQNGTTKTYNYQCKILRNPLLLGSSQKDFVVNMGSDRAIFTITPWFQTANGANYDDMIIKYSSVTGTGNLRVGSDVLVSGASITASGDRHSLEYVPSMVGNHSFDVTVTSNRGISVTQRYTVLARRNLGAFNVICPATGNMYPIPFEVDYADIVATLVSEISDPAAFEGATVMWSHVGVNSGGSLSMDGVAIEKNTYAAIPNSETQKFRYTATQSGIVKIRLTFLLQDGRQKAIDYLLNIDDGGVRIDKGEPYYDVPYGDTFPGDTEEYMGYFAIRQKYYKGKFDVTIEQGSNQIMGVTELKIMVDDNNDCDIRFDTNGNSGHINFYITAVNEATGESCKYTTPTRRITYHPDQSSN